MYYNSTAGIKYKLNSEDIINKIIFFGRFFLPFWYRIVNKIAHSKYMLKAENIIISAVDRLDLFLFDGSVNFKIARHILRIENAKPLNR